MLIKAELKYKVLRSYKDLLEEPFFYIKKQKNMGQELNQINILYNNKNKKKVEMKVINIKIILLWWIAQNLGLLLNDSLKTNFLNLINQN